MFEPGTLLQGRYEIVRHIGKGGMGAVYEAVDQRLRSTVALKQTLIDDEKLNRAFEREAILLASLRHSALVRVIDRFADENGQFLVMEFIPGKDLSGMLEERGTPFPIDDVLNWADQLLDALDYLHTQQIPVIHRDIKPQNLKLTPRGEIILLDFGLAKGSSSGLQSQVTTEGSIFGYTPKYAPIEQIQGKGTDPRSDLYALSVTLFHLLTDQMPVDALARVSAVVNNQPDPQPLAHVVHPAIPQAVSMVLAKAMALGSDERFANAADMRAELRRAREMPTQQPASYGTEFTGETVSMPAAQQAQTQVPASYAAPPQPAPQEPVPPVATERPAADAQPKPKRGKPFIWLSIGFAIPIVLICVGFFGLAKIGEEAQERNDVATAMALQGEHEEREEHVLAPKNNVNTPVWPLVLSDNFDDNALAWPEGERESALWSGDRSITPGGRYRWEVVAYDGFVSVATPDDMSSLTDFFVSVDANLVAGDELMSFYGIAFRIQESADTSNYYLFKVADDQTFKLSLSQGDEWTTLIDWTEATAIRPGAMNTLAIVAEGSHFVFVINDQEVAEYTDSQLAKGRIGVAIEVEEDEDAVFEFDNFELHMP